VGLGAVVTVGVAVASAFEAEAAVFAGGTVAAGFDSVAVAEGLGVGVTRTWNPPQANIANSHIASAKNNGQCLGRRYIFASELVTGSWKLDTESHI
jgi:hypothetical protein